MKSSIKKLTQEEYETKEEPKKEEKTKRDNQSKQTKFIFPKKMDNNIDKTANNLNEPYHLTDVSGKIGISDVKTNKKFNAKSHSEVGKFLNHKNFSQRLEIARNQLKESSRLRPKDLNPLCLASSDNFNSPEGKYSSSQSLDKKAIKKL